MHTHSLPLNIYTSVSAGWQERGYRAPLAAAGGRKKVVAVQRRRRRARRKSEAVASSCSNRASPTWSTDVVALGVEAPQFGQLRARGHAAAHLGAREVEHLKLSEVSKERQASADVRSVVSRGTPSSGCCALVFRTKEASRCDPRPSWALRTWVPGNVSGCELDRLASCHV